LASEYNYSEIFYSVQGEGHHTGVPTAWLRFFLCNLQCNGFGQDDPTDPSTYDLPYKKIAQEIEINPLRYMNMEELPVFEKGCDSSYSWAKAFKGLQRKGTSEQISNRILDIMKNKEWNPKGLFDHPGGTHQHMCFTGGEPLMSHGQKCSIEVMKAFRNRPDGPNMPASVTYETNGTQVLSDDFKSFYSNRGLYEGELFFSVSPKLWSVTGEKAAKAINPENVAEYHMLSKGKGQLKFVLTPHKEAWEELEYVVHCFRNAGVNYPVWIMPVGATVEGQKLVDGDVARMAYQRGYNVSARVHTYLWGNLIGV
jgi:organic radical activating enzyme